MVLSGGGGAQSSGIEPPEEREKEVGVREGRRVGEGRKEGKNRGGRKRGEGVGSLNLTP